MKSNGIMLFWLAQQPHNTSLPAILAAFLLVVVAMLNWEEVTEGSEAIISFCEAIMLKNTTAERDRETPKITVPDLIIALDFRVDLCQPLPRKCLAYGSVISHRVNQ